MSKSSVTTPAEHGVIDLGISFTLPAGRLPGRDEGTLLTQLYTEAQDASVRVVRFGWAALKIKESLPHGQWGPWLAEHCPEIPERTVRHYMQLASTCLPGWQQLDRWEQVDTAKLTGRTAKALLGSGQKDKPTGPKPAGGAEQGGVKPAKADHTTLAGETHATVQRLCAELAAQLSAGLDAAEPPHLTKWEEDLRGLRDMVREERERREA